MLTLAWARAAAADRTVPDVLEVRLAPGAARGARALVGTRHVSQLGVRAVDGVARATGAWFEPEFAGETPPRDPHAIDFTAYWRMHVADPATRDAAIARLATMREVASVAAIPVTALQAVPDDSLWSIAWWFTQPAGIRATAAWDLSTGDSSIVVAIIDSGTLHHHPDLAGQFWTNRGEIPDNGIDDDSNGFIDDTWGWDFVRFPDGAGITAGEDWADQDPDPDDFAGHGTAVAGLLAAASDNHIGVTGTAWHVRIMTLRASYSSTVYPGGETEMSFAAEAVRYATRMGATVINCSFATGTYPGLDDAVTEAVRAGVTVVNAAGNNGSVHHLADREDVVAVAATDDHDVLAAFSNRGPFVDVSAPGAGLATTVLSRPGTDSLGMRQPDYNSSAYGTSFAAPLVSGAVALMQSYRRAQGKRLLLPEEVLLQLRQTADPIDAQNPGGGFGAGRLDAARALTETPRNHVVRMEGTSVGPVVVLHGPSGDPRLVVLARQSLSVVIPATHDTLALEAFPHAAVAPLAAADLGGHHGNGMFVALEGGLVLGLYPTGRARPGWPVEMTGSPAAGPSIGDVDGDGVPEIVCADVTGQVWAWHLDGTLLNGFPATAGTIGMQAGVALADLDGRPGLEIVAPTLGGNIYVFRGDGRRLPGWPVFYGGFFRGVVVARRADGMPLVIAPTTHTLLAIDTTRTVVFARALDGFPVKEPALADLDGDGEDEVLIASSGLNRLHAYHLDGTPLPNWPRELYDTPEGDLVVGPLAAGGQPAVLVFRFPGKLIAFDAAADSLTTYPLPGAAGPEPTLDDIDDDGRLELVAGADDLGSLFVYDAAATVSAPIAWPTARGNSARTGSRATAPVVAVLDPFAPDAPRSLAAGAVTESSFTVTWTAPDVRRDADLPDAYDVRAAGGAVDFGTTVAAHGAAGATERFTFDHLPRATTFHVEVRAIDGAGNVSSPVRLEVETGTGPLTTLSGVAIACFARPSQAPVRLAWRGSGGAQRVVLLDVTGRRMRALDPGSGTEGVVTWDARDSGGNPIRPGLYFARFECAAGHAMTRVVYVP